jgi:dUTP pyrophosphatase
VQVKYKLGPNGYPPIQATKYSQYDLSLPCDVVIGIGKTVIVDLQIAFDIHEYYMMMLFPRSSMQSVRNLAVVPTIVDSDYKKNVHFIATNLRNEDCEFKRGARVVQCVFVDKMFIEWIETDSLTDTGRGGLGSTGD